MRTSSIRLLGGCLFLWAISLACGPTLPAPVAQAYEDLPENIDFNFHIRPILSDRCFSCHGPDENSREADLRLDLEKYAFESLSSGNGYAIVAGNSGKSESVNRILSNDPTFQMPPPKSNLVLSEREKAMLIKWIDQGADWKEHWAFIKPQKVSSPEIKNKNWPQENEIDAFIYKGLEVNGFEPTEKADKERLLRRLSMDLRGLPPSIEEIEDFLTDQEEDAYEKAVDKMLDSEAHAERLAMDWMDLARYADSHGMHADGWRMMWPWRDWVIKAFKKNMPYDEFVAWQLAGDLMDNASHEQKLATAFNRNHPMTAEGGVIDEEFRLGYVFDRTETVATAFMGLTVGCARCHDHKFDPISQKEYYQLTAFFNNVKELGMTGDDGNYGPMLEMADEETVKKLDGMKAEIETWERKLSLTEKELIDSKKYVEQLPRLNKLKGRIGYYPFDNIRSRRNADRKKTWANGVKDAGFKYVIDNNTASASNGKALLEKGKIGNALRFTGDYDEVYLQDMPNFEWTDPFSVGLWMNSTKRKKGETQTLLGTTGEKNTFWRGWEFYLDTLNRLNARIIHSLPHNYIHLRAKDSIQINQWLHAGLSYKGSGKAKGLKLFLNGKEMESEVIYDRLYKSSQTVGGGAHKVSTRPIRVAQSYRGFTGESGYFIGRLDDIQLFNRELSPVEVARLAGVDQYKPEDVQMHFVQQDKEVRKQKETLRELRNEWLKLSNTLPEVMVMEELPKPRETFAYNRGEYDSPIYKVSMATPEVLPEFSPDYPQNRLGLAKWIFDKNNPLTARVTVNRYWQMLFGKGLVKTPQDFGVQGELPSHPELLDWLAVEFMESDWNVRHLLKTMVLSATYQQSSETSPEQREKDPENIWLARGSSYRLPAEMIRDNALAASGLLVQKVGGESVRPYQPPGLWIEKGNFSHKLLNYKVTGGDSLYRRSLYTFVKRTSPHPAMTAFDAPNRDICTVKRENTNTPLQALVLLNDPQFVEPARVLAERIQKEEPEELASQINLAFRLSTGRNAKEKEIALLSELYSKQFERFKEKPEEARELLSFGDYPRSEELDVQKTAALAVVSSTILNHDEAYMKR